MKRREKIRYYRDLMKDDFAGTKIKTAEVGADFPYRRQSKVYKTGEFLLYELIARPLVTLFMKTVYRQKFVNRKAICQAGDQGAFIYANHTLTSGDAYLPNMLCWRKKNYIICGPDAVSVKGIRTIVCMLGAIPIPSGLNGYREYINCLRERIGQGATVTIYPEAHIWPYYTGIRPFTEMSFRYPVEMNVPVFVMTNTFHRRKYSLTGLPKVITYVDGPFFPDTGLKKNDAVRRLRDTVFQQMLQRAETSDYSYITYLPEQDRTERKEIS